MDVGKALEILRSYGFDVDGVVDWPGGCSVLFTDGGSVNFSGGYPVVVPGDLAGLQPVGYREVYVAVARAYCGG